MKRTMVIFCIFCVHTSTVYGTNHLRWIKPASTLQYAIRMAKLQQGPDKLIVNDTFNERTVFARAGAGKYIFPLLPATPEQNALRTDMDILKFKKKFWLKMSVIALLPTCAGLLCGQLQVFVTSGAGLISGLILQSRAKYNLGSATYNFVRGNRYPTLSASDRTMLLLAAQKDPTRKEKIVHLLEDGTCTWYYPRADWMKLGGNNKASLRHILTTCSPKDPHAFPIATLPNMLLYKS